VVLTGRFDDWERTVPMSFDGNSFVATVHLPESMNEDMPYKFFVTDSNGSYWTTNNTMPTTGEGVYVNNVFTVHHLQAVKEEVIPQFI